MQDEGEQNEPIILVIQWLIGLGIIGYIVVSNFPNLLGVSADLYNCEAHMVIKQCKVTQSTRNTGEWLDCVLSNNGRVTVNPNTLSVWNYDGNGVLLGRSDVHSSVTIPTGQSSHIEMTIKPDTKEAVICSMDPNSSFVMQFPRQKVN